MKAFITRSRSQAPSGRQAWLFCLLAGLGAGLLNGLLGAAGGILLVAVLPRLVPPPSLCPDRAPGLFLGADHGRRDILATALAVMLPVSAVSSVFYWMGGIRPDWGILTAIALPCVVGGIVGARLLGRLPEDALRRIFAALVVVSGLRMLF